MSWMKKPGRTAGLLYLLLGVTAPLNLLYLPSRFFVTGDAAATARNITSAELTYRLCVLSGLVSSIVFLFLALSLYELFRDVDRKQSRLLVTLVAVSAALSLANLINELAPLVLLSRADSLTVFTRSQLEALALVFLRLRGTGIQIVTALWGLWLLPFGILVVKSRYFPRVLGYLLIAGCFGYLAVSFTALVLPVHQDTVSRVLLPVYAVGEPLMMIWLIVKGAKVRTSEEVRS
jgi:uncharacterized protein DUF4386